MVSTQTVRQLALGFPETEELPHFHLTSFRVRKKIFITMDEKLGRVMVKLNIKDQSVFCSFDKTIIYPVPGSWGRKGCTFVNLEKVRKSMLKDALTVAYCKVAPLKLAEKFLLK
jgi:predicted DNA-binding protein (MmcQ/YjbR family)